MQPNYISNLDTQKFRPAKCGPLPEAQVGRRGGVGQEQKVPQHGQLIQVGRTGQIGDQWNHNGGQSATGFVCGREIQLPLLMGLL